jgi:hypothetical protein
MNLTEETIDLGHAEQTFDMTEIPEDLEDLMEETEELEGV